MKPRERMLKALNHEEPDRVPIDVWIFSSQFFGADIPYTDYQPLHFTGGRNVVEMLKKHFNVTENIALWRKLGQDLPFLALRDPSEEFKQRVCLRGDKDFLEGVHESEFGVKYRLGATGRYWHWVYHPLQDKESADEFEFLEIDIAKDFSGAEKLVREYGDQYVILGGLTNWGFFNAGQLLRGWTRFIRDLYVNPRFANRLLDKILQFNIEEGRGLIEKGVDAILIGDDIGMQTGMYIPPKIWRKYIKPRMKKMIDSFKSYGDVFVFCHSDGNFEDVIPDLIEVGVDILNPIQPDCMDPAKVKEEYGDKVTLYGSVSIQETLPFGSTEDVASEVKTRIKTMAQGGGMIIGSSHFIEDNVPLSNILTLFETAKKYGKYPISI